MFIKKTYMSNTCKNEKTRSVTATHRTKNEQRNRNLRKPLDVRDLDWIAVQVSTWILASRVPLALHIA